MTEILIPTFIWPLLISAIFEAYEYTLLSNFMGFIASVVAIEQCYSGIKFLWNEHLKVQEFYRNKIR